VISYLETDTKPKDPEYEDQIVCPYCGDVDYDNCDYPRELKMDGDSTTVTCGSCGKDYDVIISISIAYLSEPIPEALPLMPDTKAVGHPIYRTSPDYLAWLNRCDEILKTTWPDYPFRDQAGQLDREAWYKTYFEDGGTSPEEAVAEEIDASN